METCYRKGLKWKRSRDLKGKTTEQSCSEQSSKQSSNIIVEDIDKV